MRVITHITLLVIIGLALWSSEEETKPTEVSANETKSNQIRVIVAAKEVDVIDAYAESSKINKFDLVIDLQTKLRNTLILKRIPTKNFYSATYKFIFSSTKNNYLSTNIC